MEDTLHVSSREFVHQFSHYVRLANSGKQIVITRRGTPTAKLVPFTAKPPMSRAERKALLAQILSFRFSKPYGKKFERSDAYGEE